MELLIAILGQVIGGLILAYFTGIGQSSGGWQNQRIVVVERRTTVKTYYRDREAQQSESEDGWLYVLMMFMILAAFMTFTAAIYVKFLPFIRPAIVCSTFLTALSAGALLFFGMRYNERTGDETPVKVASRLIAPCITYLFVLWVLDFPPAIPPHLERAEAQLHSFQLSLDGLFPRLISLFMDNRDAMPFLSMRLIGVAILFFSFLINIYVQLKTSRAIHANAQVHFYRHTLWAPFLLAVMSLLLIGFYQIWADFFMRMS